MGWIPLLTGPTARRSIRRLRSLAAGTVLLQLGRLLQAPFLQHRICAALYLGAYTQRIASSNTRLIALAETNVPFRRKDSARGDQKRLTTLADIVSESWCQLGVLHDLIRW